PSGRKPAQPPLPFPTVHTATALPLNREPVTGKHTSREGQLQTAPACPPGSNLQKHVGARILHHPHTPSLRGRIFECFLPHPLPRHHVQVVRVTQVILETGKKPCETRPPRGAAAYALCLHAHRLR